MTTSKTREQLLARRRELYRRPASRTAALAYAARPDNRARRSAANRTPEGRLREWRRKGLPEPTRPMPQMCECCGQPSRIGRLLALDHDHLTGEFRGWLCHMCNTAIGKLGDDLEGVMRAIDYLRRNGA